MKIKELRIKKNITQVKLAEIINVPYRNISKYENMERQPDINTLIKFADYFNVSLDYLVERPNANQFNINHFAPAPLPKDQQSLLDVYISLDAHNQGALFERAQMLSESQEKEKVHEEMIAARSLKKQQQSVTLKEGTF